MERKRSIQIKFYLTEKENKILIENIRESGSRNKSEYLRLITLYGQIIKPNYEYSRSIAYQLNKIGINLNQISAKINAQGENELFRQELYKWGKELDDLWQLHMLENKIKAK